MAHTKEQRSAKALCGAKRRNGLPCRKFAGEKTDHLGFGVCALHGGAMISHTKHAHKLMAKQKMITMGQADTEVTALGALLDELHSSTGHVSWLRAQIEKMDPDDLGSLANQAILRLYDGERQIKSQVARLAIQSGVDESNIRVQSLQVAMLGKALKVSCDAIGLPEAKQRELGKELSKQLLAEEQAQRPSYTG